MTLPQTIYRAVQKIPINPEEDRIGWKLQAWEIQFKLDTRIRRLFSTLSRDVKDNFYQTIILNEYIPHVPFYQQLVYLLADADEALYGGAAGGGKSDAILMDSLQYADFPSFASLIIRRTYTDLALEGALMDRAHDWLDPTDAHWREAKKRWEFPSGARLAFRYMDNERDVKRIQGTDYHVISVDELTQLPKQWWQFLSRSKRRDAGDPIPLKKRGGSNPGDIGHEWVKAEFVNGDKLFIPSTWRDNPFIDQVEYKRSLDELDHITRQQLKYGNWDVNLQGGLFKRTWFQIVEDVPIKLRKIRFWDLAATAAEKGKDPDYTAGLLLGVDANNICYILDVLRLRDTPLEVEKLILQTALADGTETAIRIEQEGGATGKFVIEDFRRKLMGYNYDGEPANRKKYERAKPVSSYAEAGNIKILKDNNVRRWNTALLDELESFPTDGIHDDQVDALSGAFMHLSSIRGNPYTRSDKRYLTYQKQKRRVTRRIG
jgi:predicted phage terminase large subunit-like protein